ncbi:hypothetical protein ACIBK9_49790 [Nonomuraea sp. NPDC050227]|uniref:hypothetical protein n=1 Tax=Nonomuraea sp. NPDC050227 TaxID=3364360 RepID=UPI00378CBC44
MIDPVFLTAATLFLSKLIDGVTGEMGRETWNGMKRLVELVRDRLSGDDSAQEVISGVEAGNDVPEAARSLAEVLDRHAASDPAFRRTLAELIGEGMADPAAGRMVTQIYGNAEVGKVVTIGTVTGDVSF